MVRVKAHRVSMSVNVMKKGRENGDDGGKSYWTRASIESTTLARLLLLRSLAPLCQYQLQQQQQSAFALEQHSLFALPFQSASPGSTLKDTISHQRIQSTWPPFLFDSASR